MRVDADHSWLDTHGSTALWYAMLGSPFVWAIQLFFMYPAVPYACSSKSTVWLYVIGGLALLLSVASGLVAYNIWNEAGAELPGEYATRTDRTRLMVAVGMIFSALFSTILLAQLIATAILGPCIPLPRVKYTPDAAASHATQLYATAEARWW